MGDSENQLMTTVFVEQPLASQANFPTQDVHVSVQCKVKEGQESQSKLDRNQPIKGNFISLKYFPTIGPILFGMPLVVSLIQLVELW